ncbi:GNAT family N-acetyltransferase [Rhizobium sp. AAP43]|uniref:GNAT family N-acetyltransferase n=1 Tax=Rhizobium sp. AAP43 TaxID=1523420 RepID=UPI0006B8F6A0|nr:GNAT family N-acetyltransferase [Rhizobium sp. AAP43]KPF41085.1 acetyltransferase [Rhizobium sp. AAP43]
MQIRRGFAADFGDLRRVEFASFETLREAGAVSGDAMASTDVELQHYLDHDFLLAACDSDGKVIGYCGGTVEENHLHIGEMDVHPTWQRKGIGRRLITTMIEDARTRGLKGATLTTDRYAPFNARFYESLGFRIVQGDTLSPRLHKVLEAEAEKGLDPCRRVAMMLVF